jgi:hypothetical protein
MTMALTRKGEAREMCAFEQTQTWLKKETLATTFLKARSHP